MANQESKYCGIDPGVSGYICTMVNGELEYMIPMPVLTNNKNKKKKYDYHQLNSIFETLTDYKVTIERMQPLPEHIRPGGISDFKVGYGYGLMIGMLTAHKIDFQEVVPRVWQQKMFDIIKNGNTKKRSLDAANKLFPELNIKDHNKSDALLICEYGRRHTEAAKGLALFAPLDSLG